MMSRNPEATPSVHGEIMRRLAPVMILAFAVFALAGSYLYQDNIHNRVSQIHEAQLSDFAAQINTRLQEAAIEAQRLARGAATRVFTTERERLLGQAPADLLNGQAEMVADFGSVLANSDRDYFAARYIDLDGSIWGEVITRGGVLDPDTRFQRGILASDDPFQQAVQSGGVSLSAVTMRQTAPGVVEPALRLFTPVTANDISQAPLAFIELEILARPIVNLVNLANEGDGQRWLLVSRSGRYLADNTAPRAYLNNLSPGATGLIAANEPKLAAILDAGSGLPDMTPLDSDLVSARRVGLDGGADMPWMLVVVDRSGALAAGASIGIFWIVLASTLACIGMLVLSNRILRRRLASFDAVGAMVTQLAAGQTAEAGSSSDSLITALQQVSSRLRELTIGNEDQQARQQRNLEIATRITQEAAALPDVDELVNHAIDQLCSDYGFYHAQVFLMDDVGMNAVLRYSRGLIGRRLLERDLIIPVDESSIIGAAVQAGRAVVVNNTHSPENRYERLLADTRAQMALPLRIGADVIGVLDIHSIVADAFREDDQRLFQLLANQLAAAIRNARLLVDSQQQLQQVDTLNRNLTRRAWDAAQETLPSAYRYDLVAVEPLGDDTAAAAAAISAPISIRGEVIGTMAAAAPSGQPFAQGDEMVLRAVAERVGLAIEGARLFKETQSALGETRRLYDASRAITGAADLNAVYQAAVDHLSQAAAQVSRIAVLLAGPNAGMNAAYFDYVYVWDRRGAAAPPIQTGMRVSQEAAPLGEYMAARGGEAVYFPNLEAALAGHTRLRQALGRSGAASIVLVPLRSQRHWFGVLVSECDTPLGFDEHYMRYTQAVADQVAAAIENRQLFEEARQEARRALALADAGQLASRMSGDFETSLGEVFTRMRPFFGGWMVGLINSEHPHQLDIVSHSPLNVSGSEPAAVGSLDLAGWPHPLVESVRLGKLLLVNDPFQYPGFAGQPRQVIEGSGKHIAAPIAVGDKIVGALQVGRNLDEPDLDSGDEQLVATLAAQIGIAVENRRLFRGIETERTYLSSILESMPTGILVLDARTFKPVQANAQVRNLLQKPVDYAVPFSASAYSLYRTGTSHHYPAEELAIFTAAASGVQDFSDDVTVFHGGGSHTDLLLSAAPILDARGHVTNIVAAFQDISNLRGLENALQDNLRETITLYEITRSLSEAAGLDAVLDIVIMQMVMIEVAEGYITLLDEQTGQVNVVRAVGEVESFNLPQAAFQPAPLLIADTRQHPDALGAALEARGIAALASIPMRARDNLLGWMVIVYDQPHPFEPENIRFLMTLGDGAAVAIDNRNLYARTEQAYQEAATLYQTSRALSNAASSEDVLHAIVTTINRPYITQAFIAVPPPHEQRDIPAVMQVVSIWQSGDGGMNLEHAALSAELFPAWRLICAPSILVTDDALADESLSEAERIGVQGMDTRALVVLPLRAGSQLVGAIWLGSNETYAHSDQDRRIFQSLAEQASLSVQAGRLLAQTQRRAAQLSTSAEVSRIASAILDVDVLLPQLVEVIRQSFGYDHVQVFLMDAAGDYAELRASTGEAGQQLLAINHRLEKGSPSVIGQVTATGSPALALDTTDARFVHRPNPFLPLTRSEVALPLVVKGRIVGALDVQSNQPNAFTQDDVNVLQALAGQISIALDNASLFAQSERRARDMGFLFTVTSAAAMPEQSLSQSLQDVAELVSTELGALATGIYMIERYLDERDQMVEIVRPVALAGSDQPLSEISQVRVGDPQHILGIVAQSREPVILDDIQRENRYVPISASARSASIIPMASGSQVIGLIVAESAQPSAFNAETTTLLRTLNTTLSAIVQNAALLDQVQKQNDQLRELDKLKTDFLANMSHELRTPLNSIIGFSRVILKGIDGPLTEMQEQDLSTIYSSGQHLLGLINDILDQAKINSGKMDLQQDYFDIRPVMEGVRSIGTGLVKDKPIDIRLEIASGLPKAYGDEFRTRQVLLNLVSNAAKFTQHGSVILRVYLDADPVTGKDMVRVDVIDTGIGIADADLHLLFEAFRQVDSSLTRTVGGTGLGLLISKSLVEMQGGRMLVQSEVNVGSTFSVLIPLEPTDPVTSHDPTGLKGGKRVKSRPLPPVTMPETPARTSPLAEPADADAAPRRAAAAPGFVPVVRQILLIEDNPEMVAQYRRALRREGFDIYTASIPLEAEAMAGGLLPTLIIMDVDFAGGAGWDILARLRQRQDTQDIPIIVCTLNGDEQRAAALGAFAFIQRPFAPDRLLQAVGDAEADSRTERILIIDDHPESARLLQQALDENGQYRIFTATTGAEGISMVARCRPNLVILDLRMPDMDGFAVLDELQANPETAAIPVLIVTADTLNPDEQTHLADRIVFYKTDLSRDQHAQLIRNLKSHLSQHNGE